MGHTDSRLLLCNLSREPVQRPLPVRVRGAPLFSVQPVCIDGLTQEFLVSAHLPPLPDASTVRAVWLADLHPDHVKPGPGLFIFVPGSAPDKRLQCFSLLAPSPGATLWVSGGEV